MYTKKNIGIYGYFYILLLTQKRIINLWIFLYIVVDTKTKKEYIGYFYIFVLTQKVKGNLPGLFIKFMCTKKNY